MPTNSGGHTHTQHAVQCGVSSSEPLQPQTLHQHDASSGQARRRNTVPCYQLTFATKNHCNSDRSYGVRGISCLELGILSCSCHSLSKPLCYATPIVGFAQQSNIPSLEVQLSSHTICDLTINPARTTIQKAMPFTGYNEQLLHPRSCPGTRFSLKAGWLQLIRFLTHQVLKSM